MKIVVKGNWGDSIWAKRHKWWSWPLVVLYMAVRLPFLSLYLVYLPCLLMIGLTFPYEWLQERYRAAMWEQPVDRWKLFAWYVLTFLLYLLLRPLCWYTNGLTWVVSRLSFQHQPDPKGD
jgi:hypothetical protein